MKVRELLTTWGFDIDMNSLNRMDRKIGDLRNSARGLGANMKAVTDGMVSQGVKLSAFVTLPILGIGAAMIKAASDAEETESKYATVFKDISAKSEVVATDLAESFGLASDTAKRLLGDTGDLLTGFGFTGDSALDLSKGVNELAVDLASFTNFSGGAEGASAALTKALLGERESVKSLGISILESDVKAKILSLEATGKLTNESERQKKAIATLAIAVEQSGNAIGDYARTSGQFANQQRLLGQRIKTLAIAFGKILVPIALKAVKALSNLAKKFTDLSKGTKEWILISAGILAVLGPTLLILGLLGSAVLGLAGAFTVLKTVMIAIRTASLATLLVWAIVPILFAAAGVAIFALLEDLWNLATGGNSAIGFLLQQFLGAEVDIKSVVDNVSSALGVLFGWFVTLGNIEIAFFKLLGDAISGAFGDVVNLVNGGDSAIGNWLKSLGLLGEVLEQIFIGPIRLIKEFLLYINKLAGLTGIGVLNFLTGSDESKKTEGGKPEQSFSDKIIQGLGSARESTNEFFGGASSLSAGEQAISAPPLVSQVSGGASVVNNINDIKVNSTVSLEVAAGTPEEQQASLLDSAERAVDAAYDKKIRESMNEIPKAS